MESDAPVLQPAGHQPASARVDGEPSRVSRTRLDETGEEPLRDAVFEVAAGQVATVRLRPR